MLRVKHFLVVIVLFISLSLPALSQATAESMPAPGLIYGQASVEWPASVPDAPVLLTVSGPAGLYVRQENPAGTWGRFSLVSEQGQMRPDGIYKWELLVQAGWDGAEHATQSGWFQIQNGKVVAEGIGEKRPVVIEDEAPASSLYVDSQGRVGIGTSVPESQLHLKGILPAVTLEDVAIGGGLFTLRGLERGDGSLGLFDKAGQARWLVDSEGRIGINTTKPTSALTVDGYIEATKGFLVDGKPIGGAGFGLISGAQPLAGTETGNNNYFGTGAGGAGGADNSFFGAYAGDVNTGDGNNFFGYYAGHSNGLASANNFFGRRAGQNNTTGQGNSFFGENAGLSNIEGSDNSFFGRNAGLSNTSGWNNAFFGHSAGELNTIGAGNSFFGLEAGKSNIAGSDSAFFGREAGLNNNVTGNSFFGAYAGRSNTGGTGNAFFGLHAGFLNSTGSNNSAFGSDAGLSNQTGENNTFFGSQAGYGTTSSYNSFFGAVAGRSNTTGVYNSFFGAVAGHWNTAGNSNSFFGYSAGFDNTTGGFNSFFGMMAGRYNTGSDNSFFGARAGNANTTGGNNSIFGGFAGYSNQTGIHNSFFGGRAGYNNTASSNSFFGAYAGFSNTSGGSNSIFGSEAGYDNQTGYENSLFGFKAGRSISGNYNSIFGAYAGYTASTGTHNALFGAYAGYNNTTGQMNSFFGTNTGHENTIGSSNSFFGLNAGWSNTTGSSNALFGQEAGFWNTTGNNNSSFGRYAGNHNTVENNNTFIGYGADIGPGADPATSPVTNATAIGAFAFVAQSNSLVLGSIPGVNNGTSYVNVGIGTMTPARQLHLAGPNAVFRMDRPSDTASFILVRTDPTGTTPWKTFVVGTNATGVDQGEFIINDIGTAVGGAGSRRMTITNEGNVEFTGTVTAGGILYPSSLALKTNVRTIEQAMEMVNRLRGVRFDWKDSGKPAVGLIAEEVDQVLPELVAHEGGTARGVNYANLVAVLVEAVKEQQNTIERLEPLEKAYKEQQARIERLERLLEQRQP